MCGVVRFCHSKVVFFLMGSSRRLLPLPLPSEMRDDNVENSMQRSLADAIIRMQPLDEIRILLACGAKVNEPVTQGLRPLHYAVWQKYTQAVNLLLVRGAKINAADECGYTPLHLAAEHGYLELTQLLLEAGAKVDYRYPTDELYPRTTLCDEPLRLALRNKHYDVARLLLENGADPNKRYFFGAEINLISDTEGIELLLAFGAHTETRDRSGMTALMKAARHNQNMESILLLLSYGAEVNAMSDARNDYRTPLHYAVLSGNAVLVNLLLKQGAKIDLLPPAPEPDRPSPLHLAILRGDPSLVRILLENGANVNRCSPVIGSPLHVACADNIHHRMEIMKLLLSYGADPNIRIVSEPGSNSVLRPALAELLASNNTVSTAEIHILLKFGARVVMKTQFRDPDGILNCLESAPANSQQFQMLVQAAEVFDQCMIRRCNNLSPEQKEILLQQSSAPLTLRNQCRILIRKIIGKDQPYQVPFLNIPVFLKKYLMYEFT